VKRRRARVARLEALAVEEGMVEMVGCQEELNLRCERLRYLTWVRLELQPEESVPCREAQRTLSCGAVDMKSNGAAYFAVKTGRLAVHLKQSISTRNLS
jgi:hypothetical protein